MCIVIFFGSYIVSNSQCGQSHCGLEFEFLCFFNILSKLFLDIIKGQLISKQIVNFSFEPKNQRKSFCISALGSKSGRIKKI